ncbi:MAG: recombinase family protein [Oscillospiraceae bacterium]|nr:recombinase family protein [Oscillospiraceae bacterium]
MRAAAYARYSTEHQTENSIDTQLAAINKYCHENGHNVVCTFVDMAMSGTNTERPDFQRMIDAAKARQFDCVVIYDITRASRDVADWMGFRKLMRSYKIDVLSTTEKLGSVDDPNSFLTELLTAGLGQHMVLQTRQKSIAGVAQKAKQGVFLGGTPPLGYDVKDGKYIINKSESKAVQLIFALYAEGRSYNHIIDQVSKSGITGKRGQPIGKNSLNSILKNQRYIGNYFWNTKQRKYMGKWAGGADNPNAVQIKGVIPQIINSETWERVQKRMSDNKRRANNTAKTEYMLSGLIECGECGGTYIGRSTKNTKGYITKYYVCGNKKRTHTCGSKNFNADDIETAVVAHMRDYLLNSDSEAIADEAIAAYERARTSRPAEERELSECRRKMQNGLKVLLDMPDLTEMRDEVDKLRLRIAELEDVLSVPSGVVITREQIIDQLKKDAANIDKADMQRLVKTYITKVYAHDDKIVITGGVPINGCGRGI